MNYEVLKASVADVVKTNGNGEITGALLQQVLLAIINSLGTGYQFMGKATPSTNPGTPDQKEFYIAIDAGVYPNFGNAEIAEGNIGLFLYSSSWTLVSLAVPTKAYVDATFLKIAELADEVGEGTLVAMTQKAVSDALAEKFNASDVVQEIGESETKVISQAVISSILVGIAKDIDEIQENYAKANGTYPELTAGAADNLVGHGDTPAEITCRTAGGSADIGSGTATLSRIKGKTLAWNQLVQNGDFSNGTINWVENNCSISVSNKICTCVKEEGVASYDLRQISIQFPANHKFLMRAEVNAISNTTIALSIAGGYGALQVQKAVSANSWEKISGIVSPGNTTYSSFYILDRAATAAQFSVRNVIIFDLTAMFGAGKEPSTVAEFEALYPLPYYNYKAAELIHNKATGLKTIGFNLWDEQWESGYYTENGTEFADSHAIRTKNFIPVFPNTTYFWQHPYSGRVYFYDADKNLITRTLPLFGGATFTAPNNCYYIKFFVLSDNTGYTYNHDICINLSWSGYRNGEYEPYWESLLSLGLDSFVVKNAFDVESTITEGLKSTPNAYDEIINGEKYIRRTAIRDYESGDESDADVITDGVHTVYPLGTPEEYTLVTPIATNYRVDDFGTEERLPADTASAVSAPLVADIQYAMNAVDTLRRLPENYISKSSFDNFCTELADKLGAAIGKTITITASYDSEDKEYDFTISITTPSEP